MAAILYFIFGSVHEAVVITGRLQSTDFPKPFTYPRWSREVLRNRQERADEYYLNGEFIAKTRTVSLEQQVIYVLQLVGRMLISLGELHTYLLGHYGDSRMISCIQRHCRSLFINVAGLVGRSLLLWGKENSRAFWEKTESESHRL